MVSESSPTPTKPNSIVMISSNTCSDVIEMLATFEAYLSREAQYQMPRAKIHLILIQLRATLEKVRGDVERYGPNMKILIDKMNEESK
jgi:hypothetical protein